MIHGLIKRYPIWISENYAIKYGLDKSKSIHKICTSVKMVQEKMHIRENGVGIIGTPVFHTISILLGELALSVWKLRAPEFLASPVSIGVSV